MADQHQDAARFGLLPLTVLWRLAGAVARVTGEMQSRFSHIEFWRVPCA
jgi:hypothetical protein